MLRLAWHPQSGPSPEFWLNLQQSYDLSKTRIEEEEKITREVQAYVA
jgi:plasmid maintenance system antidote protein VapI